MLTPCRTAYDAMDRAEAWSYEAQAKEILGKLGLHDTDRFVDGLSGGEKRRVALAKCLIEQPDLLLLDEPTNHLDLGMIEWLEGFLARAKTTLLMVTHDRFFLEVVCDTILELDNFTPAQIPRKLELFLWKRRRSAPPTNTPSATAPAPSCGENWNGFGPHLKPEQARASPDWTPSKASNPALLCGSKKTRST